MKIKLTCIILALTLLSGCRLAVEAEEKPSSRDRLIGVFVTPEHLDLFDAEAYFNDNASDILNGGEVKPSGSYQKRLYTERVGGELTAPGVEGWFYCAPRLTDEEGDYVAAEGSPVFSDGHMHIFEGSSDRLELECTLYVSSAAEFVAAYINPVYQDSEGNIYILAGSGISSNGLAEGGSMSQYVEENETVTAAGKTQEKGSKITVTIAGKNPTERLTLYEMGADDSILARHELDPDRLPSEWEVTPGCEWMIIRENDERSVYGREDSSFAVFELWDNGLCVKKEVQIQW
ncbi:MAG: hypothetical protein E7442_02420 [Ruminococcaceae bacterium]|nr:hypothetical protein [Oscillospiraceae bacterium]